MADLNNTINVPIPGSPRFEYDVVMAISRIRSALGPEGTPTFHTIELPGLTATRLLATDSDNRVASTDLASWVSGTTDEVNVTNDGDGTITIGLAAPLTVSKGGTGAATLTNHSLLLGAGTGAITALGAATDGQLPIGSTGASPVLATLTQGSGITITNGAGSITIAADAGGISHNALTDLQGGTTGEYYHLTATEHGYVSGANAQSVLTTASPTFSSLSLTATSGIPFDSGGWTGRPDPIYVHSNILGDLFCGNAGSNVGRTRLGSNFRNGFLQWNRYFDGVDSQQMDATKPSWSVQLNGSSDYFAVQRSPAGSTTLTDLFRIAGSTGNVGIGLGSSNANEKLEVDGKIRANTAFNLNGTDGITVTDTVVTALRYSGATLQYKSKTITFTGGIRTATGTESDWTDVPSV